MSEFVTDIKKEYDEEGNELDKHGFKVKKYPDGLESVRKSVENCEMLCGLDKKEEVEFNSTAPDTDVNNVEWDLEDMKKAYIDSAEQQWDKYAGG